MPDALTIALGIIFAAVGLFVAWLAISFLAGVVYWAFCLLAEFIYDVRHRENR